MFVSYFIFSLNKGGLQRLWSGVFFLLRLNTVMTRTSTSAAVIRPSSSIIIMWHGGPDWIRARGENPLQTQQCSDSHWTIKAKSQTLLELCGAGIEMEMIWDLMLRSCCMKCLYNTICPIISADMNLRETYKFPYRFILQNKRFRNEKHSYLHINVYRETCNFVIVRLFYYYFSEIIKIPISGYL